MGRRTLLLIASILVAAVGTALIYMYVKGADVRARDGAKTVPVVVTTEAIPAGQTVANSRTSFGLIPVPVDNLPEANYFAGDDGLSKLRARGGDRALQTIAKNHIIVDTDFVGAEAAATSDIGLNQLGMSVQLSDPDRIAGALKPGQLVAVIVTGKLGAADDEAEFLMSGIRVISVGGSGLSSPSETVDNKIVYLSVTPGQALNLRLAEQKGNELSLAILGPKTTITSDSRISSLTFSGSTP